MLWIMEGRKGLGRGGLCGKVCSITVQEKEWALGTGDEVYTVASVRGGQCQRRSVQVELG